MGFEIPVDLDYFSHPKTINLVTTLGPEADIYPIRLWAWASKYAKDGIVKNPKQIEVACGWKGEEGKCLKALIDCGFIEKDGTTIHDWEDHIGRAVSIYEARKERQREYYARTHGVEKPPKVIEPKDEVARLLRQKAKQRKLRNVPSTVRLWIEAHVAAGRAKKLDEILSSDANNGASTIELDNKYFKSNGAVPTRPLEERIKEIGGSEA